MRSRRLITWILAFLPLIITVIALPVLSDKIPAHYGLDGYVTRFGSKYEMLLIPMITIIFCFLWLFLEKHLMKDSEKGPHNVRVIFWISLIVNLTFTALTAWFLHTAYVEAESIKNVSVDYLKIVAIALSINWIVIGNVLPKCKQNGLVGIRTPWTLASENNWYKTHRMGGKIALITGIISGLLCIVFNGTIGMWISLGSSIAMLVPIVIYSYLVYKHEG